MSSSSAGSEGPSGEGAGSHAANALASSAASELAAQEKLEGFYADTYRRLWRWRDAIMVGQEVLVWRKPLASAFLYVAIHWMFV